MKTVAQVLEEAQKRRVGCTERTFWKYHKLGLLPEGRKISGRGNAVYFPDDTALRLWIIQLLTKELEFSLSDISRYPWSQFEVDQLKLPLHTYPGELILETKNQYDKLKGAFLRQLIDKLVEDLKSATDRRQASNGWGGNSLTK
jgi:DNA-binding transcriptional MerR regulator